VLRHTLVFDQIFHLRTSSSVLLTPSRGRLWIGPRKMRPTSERNFEQAVCQKPSWPKRQDQRCTPEPSHAREALAQAVLGHRQACHEVQREVVQLKRVRDKSIPALENVFTPSSVTNVFTPSSVTNAAPSTSPPFTIDTMESIAMKQMAPVQRRGFEPGDTSNRNHAGIAARLATRNISSGVRKPAAMAFNLRLSMRTRPSRLRV
jgi:hypothetical protein